MGFLPPPKIDFGKMPKYLTPFLQLYLQKYVHRNYPKWVSFLDRFLRYLELKNEMYVDEKIQKKNSIYNNINDFKKFSLVDEFPTENQEVLNAFIKDYARVLDFRNANLSYDSEMLRVLCKYSNLIYGTKDTYKAYAFIFAILHEYYLKYGKQDIKFIPYYVKHTKDFSTEKPPHFYYQLIVNDISAFFYGAEISGKVSKSVGIVKLIDVDEKILYLDDVSKGWKFPEIIILNGISVAETVSEPYPYDEYMAKNMIVFCDQPVYELTNVGFNDVYIDRKLLTNEDKAKKPFFYQIVTKSPLISTGNFNSKLKTALHPAGFYCETIYTVDDLNPVLLHTNSRVFPKRTFDVDSNI